MKQPVVIKAVFSDEDDKGMPVEQVQVFLGHSKIDPTLYYAQIQQKNVMNSYQKYIC